MRNILIRCLSVWVFELESRVGVLSWSWRMELELECGVGDLRILCGTFLP